MPRYIVTGALTISVYTEVEALNANQAKALASARPVVGLCHQCSSGEPGTEWVTSGELDGEPRVLRVEALESNSESKGNG